jgi:2-oxoglutarate ferredoxin oxidoreductase subunit beta
METVKKAPELMNYAMFCAGCGHGVLLRLICECIEEYGLEKKTIAAIGVGCSCHLKSGINVDLVQSPHGRTAAVATGIRRVEPDKFVFTYQGDGDAYNIGLAETLNAAYRNENICVFTVNNSNFGMTGGQMAWTTMPGQVTTTSPNGRDCDLTGLPIKVPELIAHSFTPAYVARGAVTTPAEINRLKGYIKNAFEAQLNHEGYSMVEVMSSCPTNWKMDPHKAKEHLVSSVIPYYELGEICRRGEKR